MKFFHIPVIYTATLLIIFLPVAYASIDPTSGWEENTGSVTIERDNRGGTLLKWAFKYKKDSCYIHRNADSSWRSMTFLSFSTKSDRSASLFLRLDLDDGRIFLLPFHCGTEWSVINVPLESLQPFGNTRGNFQADRLKSIFIVDLNGKDNGLTGNRTVWFADFKFNKKASDREKTLKIIAFNSRGELMSIDSFRKQGLSADRWCFLTDSKGDSVPSTMSETSVTIQGEKGSVPQVTFPGTSYTKLEIMFWQPDSRHKVWLCADNNGKGIEQINGDKLFLNRELAVTRALELEKFIKVKKLSSYSKDIEKFKKAIATIPAQETLLLQAKEYDRLLAEMLSCSRDAVAAFAQEKIRRQLTPSVPVSTDIFNKTFRKGEQVRVRLVEPAFRIGFGQSFGFQSLSNSPERIKAFYYSLKAAGFNHADMPLFWDQVVDKSGRFTKWEDLFQFGYMQKLGFTLLAHGLVQTGMPEKIRKLQGQRFSEAAEKHLAVMIEHLHKKYGDSIILWEVANEPSSNPWGNLNVQQRQQLILDVCGVLKARLPGAVSMVNDYDWQRGEELSPALQGRITGTLQFYRGITGHKNSPDVLGIEWYPGVHVKQPRFGVDMAEPCMDILDTYFYWKRLLAIGKPLFITESGFPGIMSDNDQNGYAWGRWNSRNQAQAAVDTLMLTMAMDEIKGWVWWGVTDEEPWNVNGGLFNNEGQSKPVLTSIAKTISSFKTRHAVQVSAESDLLLPASAGRYCIETDQNVEYLIHKNSQGRSKLLGTSCKTYSLNAINLKYPPIPPQNIR